jgi:transposase
VSGLNDLTREELVALVVKLHNTAQAQKKDISELKALLQNQAERIEELEEEVARLRGCRPSAELCVKPSAAKKEKKPRKKRKHSFARHCLPATRVVYHAVEECPDCGRKLWGGSVKWRHQVLDIPPVLAEVTDHLFVERRCGVCGKRWTPKPRVVLADVVVGEKTIGIGLMSLVGHLKTVCRVPIGQIQGLLSTLFGVRISIGQIAEILHDVAEIGESEYEKILSHIRGSPVVCGDETGWREDGVNGYLWSFSSPQARYYTYRHSRGSIVVKEVLGEEFTGALVSDFYAAYNIYDGLKQRCWVHLMRDLEALVEKNPDLPQLAVWVEMVADVYYRAKETTKAKLRDDERREQRQSFEDELLALCRPYVGDKTAPQRVLSERIERFIAELLTFVQYPEVPSENNAAERAIRPAVVARKISGGTRSEKGSRTSSVLRTLFETWTLQGHNTLDACKQMLASQATTSLAR